MTTSTAVPSPVPNGTDGHRSRDLSKRRSKKKLLTESDNNRKVQSVLNLRNNDDYETVEWKSEAQQQVYRSKLHKALRQIRSTGNSTGTGVRETADRVLAATAKGRTRWSRAILTNKLQLKFVNNRRQRGLIVTATGNSRLRRHRVRIPKLKRKNLPVVNINRKSLPAVQRKARVLGGLVPGCRKQSLPVVLKEATDYIPALEMQVKAMAALVELLSGGASSASGAGAGDVGRLGLSRPSPCL